MRKSAVFLFLFLFSILTIHPLFGQNQDTERSYLALGDSYTIGVSVSDSDRWPVQLAKALREEGVKIERPKIIAQTGWTTEELDSAITQADLSPPYSLVTLLIGVNDQYRGYDMEKYPGNFLNLLEQAISFAGGNTEHVVVVSIPDYGVTPFGQEKNPAKIAREIDQYNHISQSISDSLGVSYVNITPISKEASDEPSLLATDKLHPSGSMYSLWVEKIAPVVLSQLKN